MSYISIDKSRVQQRLLALHQQSSTPDIYQPQSPCTPPRASTPQFGYYNQLEPQRVYQRPSHFTNEYRGLSERGLKPQSITPPEQRTPPFVEMKRPMTPNNDVYSRRLRHPNEISCHPTYQISQLARKDSGQWNIPARDLQGSSDEAAREKEVNLLRELRSLKKENENLKRENTQLKREKENSNEEWNKIYFEKYQAMNLLNQETIENEKLTTELEMKNIENQKLRQELDELKGQHLVSRRAIFETGYSRSHEDKYYIAPTHENVQVPSQKVSAMKGQYANIDVEEMRRKLEEREQREHYILSLITHQVDLWN